MEHKKGSLIDKLKRPLSFFITSNGVTDENNDLDLGGTF